MLKRKVIQVRYDKKDEEWDIKYEGSKRAIESFDTKAEAEETAFEKGRSTPHSQVKVFKKDGKIEFERTYGEDPRRYPG